jgi:hypothetical protein
VISDVYGKEIMTLVNKEQDAGIHSLDFAFDKLPEGYYYCRLQAGTHTETISIVKMK